MLCAPSGAGWVVLSRLPGPSPWFCCVAVYVLAIGIVITIMIVHSRMVNTLWHFFFRARSCPSTRSVPLQGRPRPLRAPLQPAPAAPAPPPSTHRPARGCSRAPAGRESPGCSPVTSALARRQSRRRPRCRFRRRWGWSGRTQAAQDGAEPLSVRLSGPVSPSAPGRVRGAPPGALPTPSAPAPATPQVSWNARFQARTARHESPRTPPRRPIRPVVTRLSVPSGLPARCRPPRPAFTRPSWPARPACSRPRGPVCALRRLSGGRQQLMAARSARIGDDRHSNQVRRALAAPDRAARRPLSARPAGRRDAQGPPAPTPAPPAQFPTGGRSRGPSAARVPGGFSDF